MHALTARPRVRFLAMDLWQSCLTLAFAACAPRAQKGSTQSAVQSYVAANLKDVDSSSRAVRLALKSAVGEGAIAFCRGFYRVPGSPSRSKSSQDANEVRVASCCGGRGGQESPIRHSFRRVCVVFARADGGCPRVASVSQINLQWGR